MTRQVNVMLPYDDYDTKIAQSGGVYASWGQRSIHRDLWQYSAFAAFYWLTASYSQAVRPESVININGSTTARYALYATLNPNSDKTDQGGYYVLSWMSFHQALSGLSASNEVYVTLRSGTDPDSTSDRCLYFRVNYNGTDTFTLSLHDGSGTQLGSAPTITTYTEFQVEVYFGTTSSDNWQWWFNGTSQGSGSTGNFSNAPDYVQVGNSNDSSSISYEVAFANIILQSGCSSIADRLGANFNVLEHRWNYLPANTDNTNGLGSNPTTGGDTLSSGTLGYLFSTSSLGDSSTPTFAPGSCTAGGKSAWTQANGVLGFASGILGKGLDQSISSNTSDPGSVWTNLTYPYHEDSFEYATTTTQGTSSSNYGQYNYAYRYSIGLWDHPEYFDNYTILGVALSLRIYGGDASTTLGIEVRTHGWSESLYSNTFTPGALTTTIYEPLWLTAPTGGWTWTNFHQLDTRVWKNDAGTGAVRLYNVTFFPVAQESFPNRVTSSDPKWMSFIAQAEWNS